MTEGGWIALLRLSALRERVRTSLWFWPAISVLAAVVAGVLLPGLESGTPEGAALGFAGTPEGARAVLSVVASSTITVTALTFSLTVVALQVASSQFTPRLLGTFLSDRGNQAVLSVFLGTFAYSLIVLRSVRSSAEDSGPFVPDVAVGVGLVLALLSVAMLVYFFHHLTQQFRVESVLAGVRDDTLALIHRHVPVRDGQQPELALPPVPDGAVTLRAGRSGYLQAVDERVLLRVACEHAAVVRLRPVLGTHVTAGTTLAWAWSADSAGAPPAEPDALVRGVHESVQLGPDRTLQQDVAFGVRQLADIATRALSPGINDPTTAVDTIGALASVLCELSCRHLAPLVGVDDQGRVRAAAPQPSFAEILALACDQPRRYGRTEPAVLTELLRMLTDLAEVGPAGVADTVGAQVDATVETARAADLSPPERARVTRLADHARAALDRGCRVAEAPGDGGEPAP